MNIINCIPLHHRYYANYGLYLGNGKNHEAGTNVGHRQVKAATIVMTVYKKLYTLTLCMLGHDLNSVKQ